MTPEVQAALILIKKGVEYRLRNLEVTCPGEHEWEPHCDHGAKHDPCLQGLRAAEVLVAEVQRLEAIVGSDHPRHCSCVPKLKAEVQRLEAQQQLIIGAGCTDEDHLLLRQERDHAINVIASLRAYLLDQDRLQRSPNGTRI